MHGDGFPLPSLTIRRGSSTIISRCRSVLAHDCVLDLLTVTATIEAPPNKPLQPTAAMQRFGGNETQQLWPRRLSGKAFGCLRGGRVLLSSGALLDSICQCVRDHMEVLTAAERSVLLDAIREQLAYEPLSETRHRKPLRPNPLAPCASAGVILPPSAGEVLPL